MKSFYRLKGLALFCFAFAASFLGWSQTVYTFTNATATGINGPTQSMVSAAYASTNLAGTVTVTGGIQYWTVPSTGAYKIKALGAQGGGANGGLGASIEGEFNLVGGQVIRILVGQQGITQAGQLNSVGGGGGSFVLLNPAATLADILVIAGGGGGSASAAYPNAHGSSGNSGNNGFVDVGVANPDGIGGSGGNGGNKSVSGCSLDRGAGGGGFLTNGGDVCQTIGIANGGGSYLSGGLGGTGTGPGANGGFGGGGSTWQTGFRGSGGGGGYSGGGAGQTNADAPTHAGGGGGSYNTGTNVVNTAGVNSGHGLVEITFLQSYPNDAGISGFSGIAPPFCNGPLPVSAVVQNYGNNIVNQVSIHWTFNGIVQTPVSVTTPLDTVGGTGLSSVTVALGSPVVSGPSIIKAWTVSPNGASDIQNFNDTNSISFSPFNVNAQTAFNLNCFGDASGLITTSVTFATGPVTYLWSNGATTQNLFGATAGTYTVTATNGACTDVASATVTSPPQVLVNDVTVDVLCFGDTNGSSSLFISGGTPGYTVNWTGIGPGTSISNLAGGTYNYVVTDNNGCQIPGSVVVDEPAILAITSVITPVTAPNNGAIDVSVSGGTPTYSYSWSPGGQTSQDLTSLAPGTYTVTVADGNSCVQTFTSVVQNTVGLEEQKNFDFSVYPNPSNERFTIQTVNAVDDVTIEVYDLLGKRIQLIPNAKAKTTISLKERDGVYLIKITSGQHAFVKRIVLKK